MESPGYYAVLPACVRYDKRLKPMERLLFAELTALSQKDGYSWATNGYFAELYDVSKETVSRWMKDLQDCGYIKICIDHEAGNGRRVIVFDPSQNQYLLTKRSRAIDENIKTPIDKKVKQNNTSNNNKKEHTRAGLDYRFERFYSAYPKKRAKAAAMKAFRKINPDDRMLELMILAVERSMQSTDWKKEGGQFIPYPATWLNGRRWEDDAAPVQTKEKWRQLE